VYYRSKRYPEAIAAFKTAIGLRANFGEAHFNLAVTYVALGDKKKVLEEYQVLKSVDPKLAEDFFGRFIKKPN
ncbi:MAG: hypothetical protein QOD33_244, partial [Pyrinomonadaceae bacterium]|nr:hypothetical protein [Pyrinomonadaceae bacterium]